MKNFIFISIIIAILPLFYFWFIFSPDCIKYEKDLIDELHATQLEGDSVARDANKIYKDFPEFAQYNTIMRSSEPLTCDLKRKDAGLVIATEIVSVHVPMVVIGDTTLGKVFSIGAVPERNQFSLFYESFVGGENFTERFNDTLQIDFYCIVFNDKRNTGIQFTQEIVAQGDADLFLPLEIQWDFVGSNTIQIKIRSVKKPDEKFQTFTTTFSQKIDRNFIRSFFDLNDIVITTPFTKKTSKSHAKLSTR